MIVYQQRTKNMAETPKPRTFHCLVVAVFLHSLVCLAAGLLPPSLSVIDSYNLDYKVSWTPPSDAENVRNLLYTVVYADTSSIFLADSFWIPVHRCINISLPSCNISVVFNESRDFTTKMVLRVVAIENGETSNPLQVTLYPDRHVYISAPTISVTKVTETFLGVNLIGPESPYLDLTQRGKYLRIEEVASTLKQQISFLVRLEGPGIKRSRNTTAMFPYVEFNNLSPGLTYNVSAITSYRGLFKTTYSKNRISLAVFTTLIEKLHRPNSVELKEESGVNCSLPDLRDVLVKWQRPRSPKPIIFYDLRSWVHGQKGNVNSVRIPSDVNQTNYSFVLRNMPRWSQIDVVVSANTTAVGCSSIETALAPHSVDEDSSRPENLTFITTSSDSGLIVWNTPSSCKECIIGYEVSWRLSVHDTRNASKDIVPADKLQYELKEDVVSKVSLVAVSTLLISGADTHKTGQQAVLGIHLEGPVDIPVFFVIFSTCLGALVIALILLLIFYKNKTKRKRKFEDATIKFIFSAKDSGSEILTVPQNPQTSSSARHYSRSMSAREPEIFDELLSIPPS